VSEVPIERAIEQLLSILYKALQGRNQYYTNKAVEFLRRMGVSGCVVVSSYRSEEIPYCGLACSMGVGGLGIIFVERRVLEEAIPESLKDFIVAHELAHIVRSHVVARLIARSLLEIDLEALGKVVEELTRSKMFVEALPRLFILSLLMYMAGWLLKVDVEEVRRQELEADGVAVQLAGCEGARLFIDFLRSAQRRGYYVSHEAVLGLPALTIEERIKYLAQYCY